MFLADFSHAIHHTARKGERLHTEQTQFRSQHREERPTRWAKSAAILRRALERVRDGKRRLAQGKRKRKRPCGVTKQTSAAEKAKDDRPRGAVFLVVTFPWSAERGSPRRYLGQRCDPPR